MDWLLVKSQLIGLALVASRTDFVPEEQALICRLDLVLGLERAHNLNQLLLRNFAPFEQGPLQPHRHPEHDLLLLALRTRGHTDLPQLIEGDFALPEGKVEVRQVQRFKELLHFWGVLAAPGHSLNCKFLYYFSIGLSGGALRAFGSACSALPD